MTTAFHSFNSPSQVFSNINFNHSKGYGTKANPAFAIPPSSIFFRTDENSNIQDSKKSLGLNSPARRINHGSALLKHDNTIGIIGGVRVDSTLSFLNKLVELSSKNGQNCPPFVLCSDPVLSKDILPFIGRFSSTLLSINEEFQIDHTSIVEYLRRKRVFLENSGAQCIVMPCHTLHSWYDEVSSGCSVPFLHMGECVARELKEANLKPIEMGSHPRIGVLAMDTTILFYQEKLLNEGFEVVLPDKATMEHITVPAIEAIKRKDIEGAQNLLRIALQVLLVRAVNTVVLASEDMHKLLPENDPLFKKCIDPMDALARSTIEWAQLVEKQ